MTTETLVTRRTPEQRDADLWAFNTAFVDVPEPLESPAPEPPIDARQLVRGSLMCLVLGLSGLVSLAVLKLWWDACWMGWAWWMN